MAYLEQGIDQRLEVSQGLVDSLVYFAKANGQPVTVDPATAWVTIIDPGGSSKVARTQTGVVIAANGKITFSQTWTEALYERWEDYTMLVEYAVSSVVYSDRVYFDVVKNKLPCLIDVSDLLDYYPDLEEHLKGINPGSDTSEATAAKLIKRAWSYLLDRIRSGKNRPSLILDRARLVNPAVAQALHLICDALSKEEGDVWDKRSEKHLKRYDKLVSGLGDLKYDSDEDGLAGEKETKQINRRIFTV